MKSCDAIKSLVNGYETMNKKFLNIMNHHMYTEVIKNYLELQTQYLIEICDSQNYEVIVEIGCAKGTNSLLFKQKRVKYFGVDINLSHIHEAKLLAMENNVENAKFMHVSINKIGSSVPCGDRKVLVFLPFNLFGNLKENEILQLIELIKNHGWDLLIFSYQKNLLIKAERLEYYKNCGFVVKYFEDEDESVFYSEDGFMSKVYGVKKFEALFKPLTEKNYVINKFNLENIGIAYGIFKAI